MYALHRNTAKDVSIWKRNMSNIIVEYKMVVHAYSTETETTYTYALALAKTVYVTMLPNPYVQQYMNTVYVYMNASK